jgi:hypothetical protein
VQIFFLYQTILYICIGNEAQLKTLTMIRQFILKENVLTDNILQVPSKGKVFSGGYIALIKEYQYQNPWMDKETIKRFRSKDRLNAYLDKYYSEADLDFYDTCIE